jgi:hypothetical protein
VRGGRDGQRFHRAISPNFRNRRLRIGEKVHWPTLRTGRCYL